MAKDDQDIDEMMRRIDALQQKMKLRSRGTRSFAEEFQADLERENFRRRSWGQTIRNKSARAGDWVSQKCFRFVYGYPQPQMDEEGLMLLGFLQKSGDISENEWRRAVWQRIIRRAEDGLLYSIGPNQRARYIGKLAAAFLVIGASSIIVAILEEPFHFMTSMSWSFVVGPVLGILAKCAYDSVWGHEALAKKLRYVCPTFRLRLNPQELS